MFLYRVWFNDVMSFLPPINDNEEDKTSEQQLNSSPSCAGLGSSSSALAFKNSWNGQKCPPNPQWIGLPGVPGVPETVSFRVFSIDTSARGQYSGTMMHAFQHDYVYTHISTCIRL